MLNRDDIAHEYILSGVATTVHSAFQLADAMIAEAEKRKSTERPSVVGDGWISVEDRLPIIDQAVLIFQSKVVPGTYSKCGFIEDCGNFKYYLEDVTHWQPLPQAPK